VLGLFAWALIGFGNIYCASGGSTANSMLTHEVVGKSPLGISPDETPRWG